jgi:hypothetical protein
MAETNYAFRDAELCATALDQTFSGERSFDDAMSDYQTARDQNSLPSYELTTQFATLEPPPPGLQQLLAAAARSQAATDEFERMNSGVTSPAEFFAPANVQRILATASGESG